MSNIDVKRAHGMSKADALTTLQTVANGLQSRYGVKITFKGDSAEVKGKGVKGGARVDDTHVHLNLKLGLPARLIASKIEAGVHKALDEHYPS